MKEARPRPHKIWSLWIWMLMRSSVTSFMVFCLMNEIEKCGPQQLREPLLSQIPWTSTRLPSSPSSSTLSTTSLLSLTLDFPSLFLPVFLLLSPQLYLFIQVKIVTVEKHHRKFKLYICITGLFWTWSDCFLLMTPNMPHCTSLMHFLTPGIHS